MIVRRVLVVSCTLRLLLRNAKLARMLGMRRTPRKNGELFFVAETVFCVLERKVSDIFPYTIALLTEGAI